MTSQITPSQLIKSPDGNSALVFQPDKRLVMWVLSNGQWTKKWESPQALNPYLVFDAEGYFYAQADDWRPEWGWQAAWQYGPFRASPGPFSIRIANDATMHMYRSDGQEVATEQAFPTTAWVATPVNCIPGPSLVPVGDEGPGCHTDTSLNGNVSGLDDYGGYDKNRGECRIMKDGRAGTPRDTTQDRLPRNGGKACLPVSWYNAPLGGNLGVAYMSNTIRCRPDSCGQGTTYIVPWER